MCVDDESIDDNPELWWACRPTQCFVDNDVSICFNSAFVWVVDLNESISVSVTDEYAKIRVRFVF